MAKAELEKVIADLKLTVDVRFVPFSVSRNAKPHPRFDDYSLNWKVTLKRDGREILTTDYSAGIGHCPSYQPLQHPTIDYVDKIVFECERGRRDVGPFRRAGGEAIMPDVVNVIWSLTQDATVIDHPTFESWASDCGYNTDSRKAEAIYRTCLETALKLRAAIGDTGIAELIEAGRDY